jgi:hypothetical protein
VRCSTGEVWYPPDSRSPSECPKRRRPVWSGPATGAVPSVRWSTASASVSCPLRVSLSASDGTHDDVELELLKTVARQRFAAGQGELDVGLDAPPDAGGPLPITASRMGHLWDALSRAYDRLGFADAADGDKVFRRLVLARIIEPISKLDSLRVLEEVGVAPVS